MSLFALKHADGPLSYKSPCEWKTPPSLDAGEDEENGHYATSANEGYDRKYYCGACERLMKDPVQTECGHRFCERCHKALLKESLTCPSCLKDNEIVANGSVASLEKCFKDRAIRKEILNLQVFCQNQGCTWTGPLRELEEKHKSTCEQKLLKCPFSIVGCTEMISSHKVQEHNQACIRQHLDCMLRSLQGFMKQASVSSECPSLVEMIEKHKEKDVEFNRETRGKEFQQVKILEGLKVKVQTFENIVTVLNREVEDTSNTVLTQGKLLKDQEAVTAQLKNKIRQHEKSLCLKDLVIADLQLRLDALEHTSYDGTLVWAISDFTRKMQDAIDGRVPSILSPPFFTSHCGYMLCLRLYLNGDGVGANTHLSLFLVVMKGKYDAILEWPFSKKVTFKLLDQSERHQQVVSAFKPDVNSASFRRPVHSMNVASGCPEFFSLAQLRANWHSYVTDDVMFIKAIVDP
ncbi:TNF receptor-associated factor 2-like [Heterodontus francisci]|uniref:TNF receptor-associated factor 2-like n=1 Tax=Heterodontus francisci TaxID=7792 RepID=UPI00355B5BFB